MEVLAARLPLREQHLEPMATMAPFSRSCCDWLRRYRRAKRFAQRWRLRVKDAHMGWHCAVTSGEYGAIPSLTVVRDWLAGDPPPNMGSLDHAWFNVTISASCTGHEPTLAVADLWQKLPHTDSRSWALVRRLQGRVAVCFYVIATS